MEVTLKSYGWDVKPPSVHRFLDFQTSAKFMVPLSGVVKMNKLTQSCHFQ